MTEEKYNISFDISALISKEALLAFATCVMMLFTGFLFIFDKYWLGGVGIVIIFWLIFSLPDW